MDIPYGLQLRLLHLLILEGYNELAKQLAGYMEPDETGLVAAVANWNVHYFPMSGDSVIHALLEESQEWLLAHPSQLEGASRPSSGPSAS